MSNNVFEDYLKNFLSTNAETGYNNDVLYEPDNDPKYDRTDAEKVIAGANNAFIVLGRDRFGDSIINIPTLTLHSGQNWLQSFELVDHN